LAVLRNLRAAAAARSHGKFGCHERAARNLEDHGASGDCALWIFAAVHSRQREPATVAELPVRPVLSWKTRVLTVKDVASGQAVGYMGTFVTKAQSRIAVLPVGYADGYPRLLSNRARVIVRGEYAPVVGRVSMDLTIVDVSHIGGVAVGDEVILDWP
jgi:alanine racemase